MVVGAADVVGVVAVEPEDHTILVVDPDGVIPGQIPGEHVEATTGWDLQVVESHHGVDPVELSAHRRPELLGNAPLCLAVDTVPDVPSRVVAQQSEWLGIWDGLRNWLVTAAFEVDVLACPRGGGRLRLIALLEAGTVAAPILRHLGLPSEVPAARPARAPPLSSRDESW